MTIKEVARLADVSPAAVSRYLNGGPLSKEKKERIARAIEETGYRPNLMAKTMRTGKISQIGIIVPRIFSESVNQIMDGITEVLLSRDYLTLLGFADTRKDREIQYLEMMQSNRVAGVILMGTTMDDIKRLTLERCSLPIVITGQRYEGFCCVYSDDRNGVREMTSRMIQKGRKRPAYIGVFEEDKAAGLMRREGFQDALREAGMETENVPFKIADFTAESGYEAMKELLEEHPDLDAVMCATDIIAHGAMKALKEKGKRIPEDVSIAGVGDNWSDLVSDPSLSTVKLQQRDCGKKAARMLLELIESESSKAADSEQTNAEPADKVRHLMLGYQIIERESI